MTPPCEPPWLLAIQEIPGYNLRPLYERAGFKVAAEYSVRRALARLKTLTPRVVVADFSRRHFHDRVSNLESLLAARTRFPAARVLVLHETAHAADLAQLLVRCPVDATLPLPVREKDLLALLMRWSIPLE